MFSILRSSAFAAIPIALLITSSGCQTITKPQSELGYAYTVQPGDTIQEIAAEFSRQGASVTAHQIISANPEVRFLDSDLAGITTAAVGTRLIIPGPPMQPIWRN